jgi:hypothetical protein
LPKQPTSSKESEKEGEATTTPSITSIRQQRVGLGEWHTHYTRRRLTRRAAKMEEQEIAAIVAASVAPTPTPMDICDDDVSIISHVTTLHSSSSAQCAPSSSPSSSSPSSSTPPRRRSTRLISKKDNSNTSHNSSDNDTESSTALDITDNDHDHDLDDVVMYNTPLTRGWLFPKERSPNQPSSSSLSIVSSSSPSQVHHDNELKPLKEEFELPLYYPLMSPPSLSQISSPDDINITPMDDPHFIAHNHRHYREASEWRIRAFEPDRSPDVNPATRKALELLSKHFPMHGRDSARPNRRDGTLAVIERVSSLTWYSFTICTSNSTLCAQLPCTKSSSNTTPSRGWRRSSRQMNCNNNNNNNNNNNSNEDDRWQVVSAAIFTRHAKPLSMVIKWFATHHECRQMGLARVLVRLCTAICCCEFDEPFICWLI